MECKFIQHGIAISYNHVVKPCCDWKLDSEWKTVYHISKIDLNTWHTHPELVEKQAQLSQGQWPTNCKQCEHAEQQGRRDSARGNSNSAYAHYQHDDITLEIRPGNVCNFACQTCWPAASSRVSQYHSQAGLIDIKQVESSSIDNFDFLLPVAHRIRDVVLLGGEPFYDKSCKKFLSWAQENLSANLIMFTNGSTVDFDFLSSYKGNITLVFSLDAVGKAAEYIRFGTDWAEVWSNYQRAKDLVDVRVNITCSVYNYHHIESVIELLAQDWPEVVSFGTPYEEHLSVSSVPVALRQDIINGLVRASKTVLSSKIDTEQKHNAVKALQAIINNLKTQPWNKEHHKQWCDFVTAMDKVKHINARDYCEVLSKILEYVD